MNTILTDGDTELEKLLHDVRRTISDNKLFLARLLSETGEDESDDETGAAVQEREFEEL
ncbi:MAG: hypothetical protein PHN84_10475 [Desulfuromonadaceae bacterium]|nr:hypothetical protein [Desulfuromonadaceae bacterium]MDD2854012.1 hypothetical protein [Desulfuromonadaceae bacterium]